MTINIGTVTEAIIPKRCPIFAATIYVLDEDAKRLSGIRIPIQKAIANKCNNNANSASANLLPEICPI